MSEIQIGTVTHYFDRIGVATVQLSGPLSIGDTIRFAGHTTGHEQKVESMQLERQNVSEAKAGDAAGMRVSARVRPHDKVFKLVQEGGTTGL